MSMIAALTEFTLEAQEMLRDPSQFRWYAVTLLVLVMYVYTVEVERRRWDIVLAGLAFWLADWINEIANSLVLHFTERAALWTTTGETAYLILIGLTFEISLMFAISGIVFVKSLPADPKMKLLGLPNRPVIAVAFSLFAVFVEFLLHQTGYFHWDYWFWDDPFLLPVVVFGYLWFFLVAAWVFDMPDNRRRLKVVGSLAGIVVTALILFGPLLGWI